MSTTLTEGQKAREINAKLKAQKLIAAYKAVFCNAHGQAVIADMKKQFGYDCPRFQPFGTDMRYDPLRAASLDGANGVIMHVHNMISLPTQASEEPKSKVIKNK